MNERKLLFVNGRICGISRGFSDGLFCFGILLFKITT